MAELLDKLKKTIDQSITTVSVKSKEMLETTQLRSQIKALQQQKRERLEELGNIVYTMLGRGTLEQDRLQEKYRALAELDRRITEKEEQIKAIQQQAQEAMGHGGPRPVATCECGADLFEESKFCAHCGKNVVETLKRAQAEGQASPSACPTCGAPGRPGAKFCGSCGVALLVKGEAGQEGRQ